MAPCPEVLDDGARASSELTQMLDMADLLVSILVLIVCFLTG